MKKKLIAASMAAAMTLSLAACGGSGASSTASAGDTASTAASTEAASGDEQINLRMAWWGSQDRHDKTIAAIELYESLNPNVKIEYEYYSFDDYFTKLKTLVASDQVWDVFQMGGNFPMYIDKICPLDDYIASGVVDTSGITDANLKITQDTEGHQLGLSNGLNSYGIAYDPAMFAEAGVAEPTDDWTWDDYANAANAIHDKLDIYGCSSMLSSEFIAGCSVYISQYGNVGEYSFFNLDLTGMGFDDAQMLTPYIQMRADSIKNGVYPDPGAASEITNIENDFLVTGEAAMTWVAANQFPTIYNVCQEQGRTAPPALSSSPLRCSAFLRTAHRRKPLRPSSAGSRMTPTATTSCRASAASPSTPPCVRRCPPRLPRVSRSCMTSSTRSPTSRCPRRSTF